MACFKIGQSTAISSKFAGAETSTDRGKNVNLFTYPILQSHLLLLMKTNIGISDKNRKEVSAILSQLLGDEHVLYTKTRNAHWNVVGSDFHAMHLFFEEQYGKLEEFIDEIAERIRSLANAAPGSMKEMLAQARLKEMPGALHSSADFIKALLQDHEQIIRQIREDAPRCEKLDDDGTNDFLVGLMESHEKMAWMLRSSLA